MTTQTTSYDFTIDSIKPTPGYVLVRPADLAKQTVGGIYLPDSKDETPAYGAVMSVGDDLINEHGTTITSPVKVGDIVIYKQWGGNAFKVGNLDHQFMKFEDILAVSPQKKGRGRPKKNQ